MKSNKKKKKRIGGTIKYLVMILVISAVLAGSGILLSNDLFALAKPDKDITVTIPEDATVGEVSKLLDKSGVIHYGSLFHLFTSTVYKDVEFRPGMWTLNSNMDYRAIVNQIRLTSKSTVTVTIPEGYTVSQITEALKKADIKGADDFAAEAASYGPLTYMYGPEPAQVKGEGFLFADTYDIPKDYTAKQLCDLMYDHTDKMLSPEIRREAAEKKMSLHDLMIIASMVEKEAEFREDQVPIASVILKRLEINMPLQIDATIQYALGKPKEHLSIADTRINSPYNTYRRTGLPPGPIGAPGMNAIKAVLAAKPGEYLYYVAKPDGHHIFTRTLDEHEVAVASVKG